MSISQPTILPLSSLYSKGGKYALVATTKAPYSLMPSGVESVMALSLQAANTATQLTIIAIAKIIPITFFIVVTPFC